MNEESWPEFWWRSVTGPRRVVDSVMDALTGLRTALIVIPDDLPWRHEMRAVVRDRLELAYGLEDLIIRTVDVSDDVPSGMDPGSFIIERFGRGDDRLEYRPGSVRAQDFISSRSILRGQLVWMKGADDSQVDKWIRFCAQYKAMRPEDGLFVIESRGATMRVGGGSIEVIEYSELVDDYDSRLFISHILSDGRHGGRSSLFRRYVSSLVSHLCMTDVEVAEALIASCDFRSEDPLSSLGKLAGDERFGRRGLCDNSDHILGLVRRGDVRGIRLRVWGAQVETLFPLVESRRIEIVDLLRDEIDGVISDGLIQNGEVVESVEDVELGTIVYLLASRNLFVPDDGLRSEIHRLRECRNLLAHREMVPLELVKELVGVGE